MSILSIASDSDILKHSHGEVVNFKRHYNKGHKSVAEIGGLFCPIIFGPEEPYTCLCGIQKKLIEKTTCPVCRVDYVDSTERKQRMGHIDLGIKIISNPLFYKVVGPILGLSPTALSKFCLGSDGEVTFELVYDQEGELWAEDGSRYFIDILGKEEGSIWTPHELYEKMKEYGIDGRKTLEKSKTEIGIHYYNLGKSVYDLFNQYVYVTPPADRDRRIINSRIVYAEENIIYLRLIREKYRIERVLIEDTMDEITRKRFMQFESRMIHNLLEKFYIKGFTFGRASEDGKLSKFGSKQGLFRQNLLGKRVDFSGRSVITAGPFLRPDEVGIPMPMLHELFKPILIRELAKRLRLEDKRFNQYKALKLARKEHEEFTERIKKLIEEVCPKYDVFMNRAPSLHRYSVMGHRIRVTYDKAIYFPLMTVGPYNADNDGDTLSVHLPISFESMKECRELFHVRKHIMFSHENTPNIGYSNEMSVGSYLLTRYWEKPTDKFEVVLNSRKDAEKLYTQGNVTLDTVVKFYNKDIEFGPIESYITNIGSLIVEEIARIKVNWVLGKKGCSKLISDINWKNGNDKQDLTLNQLSKLQTLFLEVATKSGISIKYDDTLKSPETTERLEKSVAESMQYEGFERTKFWDKIMNEESDKWFKEVPHEHPLYIMGQSGARVQEPQVKTMIVGKSLLRKPISDKYPMGISVNAIIHSLSEGLNPIEYMETCGPARLAFAQNAFFVPAGGYLERQLVQCGRNLVITAHDCGSEELLPFKKELCINMYSPEYGIIRPEMLPSLPDIIHVRTPITCKHDKGLCQKCCGHDPATREYWKLGTNIGVIQGQEYASVSQQLAMRGKHCEMISSCFYDINFNKIRYKDAKKCIDRGGKIYVHSINPQTGKFEVKRVVGVDISRWEDTYVKITYDNGECTKSTLDHPYLTREGKLIEAQHVKEGMSMMPYYFEKSDGKTTYNRVLNNDESGSWSVGYKLASEHYDTENIYDGRGKPGVISRHHKDFKRTNDYPTNLVICSEPQHRGFHSKRNSELYARGEIPKWYGGFTKSEVQDIIAAHNRTPERRALTGKVISEWSKNNPEQKSRYGLEGRLKQNQMYLENPELARIAIENTKLGKARQTVEFYQNNPNISSDCATLPEELYNSRYPSLNYVFCNFPEMWNFDKTWYCSLPQDFYLSKQDKQNLSFFDKYISIIQEEGLPMTTSSLREVENRYTHYNPSRNLDWIAKYRDVYILDELYSEIPYDHYWTRKNKRAFNRFKQVYWKMNQLGWTITEEKYNEISNAMFGNSQYSKYKGVMKDLPEDYMEVLKTPGVANSDRYNHKVVSVEIVKLPRKVPFAGIEVEGVWKNYPTAAGVMSHNTSGILRVDQIGKNADDTIVRFAYLTGSKLTTMGLNKDIETDKFIDIEGESYKEKALNLTNKIVELTGNNNLVYATTLVRAMSDPVELSSGRFALRSRGATCKEPKIYTVHQAILNDPSWLRKLGYGYTRKVLERALAYGESIQKTSSEQIMRGKLIHDCFGR